MKKAVVSPGFVKRTLAKLLKLDQQLGIVVNGNVASQAIAIGNYVNLINSTITGKTDGIYVATGAVSSGGTVTASDINGSAISKGISNVLSDQIANKANNKSGMITSGTLKEKILAMIAELNNEIGNATGNRVFSYGITGHGVASGTVGKNMSNVGSAIYFEFTLNSKLYCGHYISSSDYSIKQFTGTEL